jgi:hypothetical protein
MDDFLSQLGAHMTMLVIGCTVMVTFIAMSITQILQTRSKERTRREVAAYVAEGSMTTDEAERILSAGAGPAESANKRCCGGKKRHGPDTAGVAVEA